MSTYNTDNYKEQGGATWVVGGTLTLKAGATFNANTKIGLYNIGSAAASASGLLMGIGTSANPAATATPDAKFIEVRAKTTAPSGDNRLAYLRYDIDGATGGECIRAFTKVTNASATTVRGAHISIDFALAGTVSGFGAGVDAQVLLPNDALASTVTALNAELYSAGSSSSVTGGTASFIRCVAGGDATGAATVDTSGYLMSIQGLTAASHKLFQANTATAASHALRILIGSTPYYIMLTDIDA